MAPEAQPAGAVVSAETARLPVMDAIADRLEDVPGLTVYRGEITDVPPILVTDGEPDESGRVAPYAVVWGPVGRPDANPNLAATIGGPRRLGDILLTGQITFAAGYVTDILALLDDAIPLLQLWTPVIPGLKCGRLRQQPGFDPRTPRPDGDVRPPRFMTPWLWQLHVSSGPLA